MHGAYEKFDDLLKKSRNVLLISHRKPDGDTLGAASALYELTLNLGKNAVIACHDEPSDRFKFMRGVDKIVKEFDFKSFDLIVVVDAGGHYMTNFHTIYPGIFDGEVPVINIDHHVSNDNFGTLNIVDTDAASTTIILFDLFDKLHYAITPAMATSLLAGIYNDTGSFMHSNTSGEVYAVAAALLSYGADLTLIVRCMFNSSPISTLKLWGRALGNVEITSDGVAMSVITEDDYKELDANPEQLSGVIDYLNAIPDSKFSLLLSEDGKGNVKGSLRTRRDDIDLSKVASNLGGGGHSKASGFVVPGQLKKDVKYRIVSNEFVNHLPGKAVTEDLMIESWEQGK